MTLDFVLIIVTTRYLRSSLKIANDEPKWNNALNFMMFGSIACIVLEAVVPTARHVTEWVANLTLLYLIYVLYAEPLFEKARPVLVAVAPYVLVSVVSNAVEVINRTFYNEHSGLFETANLFAIIWGAGSWWMTNNQRKALDRERKRTKEEEQNNKVISAMKAELEVQVAERTSELTKQKEELQHALDELRSTQAQLIQAEKMASLGELTAGIAHEIQNPLNFVNNFAEINTELIEELEIEADKGNIEEVKALVKDIRDNEQKINHHGKRADAIVKGMLQHSRKNTGQKEATDINALADEYLRLSYHGLRAKDKTFNASMQTEFDNAAGKINVIPQDVGRVLLNLFNNAFYAVTEKNKTGIIGYKPTIWVSTKKLQGAVEIVVRDNGDGIPDTVLDKVFQPFFTTKPTGQGTGLGLSLSYDIVKAHGGDIQLETKEGEGTQFTITLPEK